MQGCGPYVDGLGDGKTRQGQATKLLPFPPQPASAAIRTKSGKKSRNCLRMPVSRFAPRGMLLYVGFMGSAHKVGRGLRQNRLVA
jgi:hypothetical protein